MNSGLVVMLVLFAAAGAIAAGRYWVRRRRSS